MYYRQTTLKSPIVVSGIGLHTGQTVTLKLLPAPVDRGLVFQRTDLDDFEIEASVSSVAKVSYATTIMKKGVLIYTVEHVLSALRGCGVSNAIVAIDNLETPILDGSARLFIEAIDRAGIIVQKKPQKFLKIKKELHVQDGWKSITISPADDFSLCYDIDFSHPLIGRQHFEWVVTPESYRREIGIARTFGFLDDVEMLRHNGLIRGGSLENAIVLTRDGMLNKATLQFQDEFVRHKVLDLIGDLALVGFPILGRINAQRAGHALHTALVSKILKEHSHWELVELEKPVSKTQPNADWQAEGLTAPAPSAV
ncbi:MAG: UDP-3-O-acyl-N-acetylglucosamine deacetylase [Acidobacteriia bacterium]|nr:UDP-3-O-acyl-N-acetylglucosamine deacetylase [Terriglobia bacterium]